MGLISFLFGKKPKVNFTPDGRVQHDLPQKKWDDWKNRFKQNPDYDWKRHSGTEGLPRFPKK